MSCRRTFGVAKAFTLLEMLIVMAIIGVLIAMLLAAAQRAREAANRTVCSSNLRQVGIALHAYHDVHNVLPRSLWDPFPTFRPRYHTGFTSLLPYVDQNALFQSYNFTKPSRTLDDPHWPGPDDEDPEVGDFPWILVEVPPENVAVVSQHIAVFSCPSDKTPPPCDTNFGAESPAWWCTNARRSNFAFCIGNGVGVDGSHNGMFNSENTTGYWNSGRSIGFAEVTDGLSNTIALGEVRQTWWAGNAAVPRHWGVASGGLLGVTSYPINQRIQGHAIAWRLRLQRLGGFGSYHESGANFLFGDDSVRFLPNTIALPVFQALGSIRQGDVGNFDGW